MERPDIKTIFIKNPMLAIHLARLSPEVLEHIEIISPDAIPEKYREFCDKLDLKRRPTIAVCRLQDIGTIEGQQLGGFYEGISHTIWLPKEILEAFQNNNPNADYIVAHELGHAKDPVTRRRFLSWGAATAGGLAAGIGTWTMMSKVTGVENEKIKEKYPIWNTATYAVNGSWSITAAYKTMRALIKATRPSTRAEEFTADDYAKQLVGLNGVVEPIMNYLIADREKKGYHDIAQLAKKIDIQLEQKSIQLTPEERKLLIALKTIQLFDAYRTPLSDMVLKDAYPDLANRLKRYETEIRDIVKPALSQGRT